MTTVSQIRKVIRPLLARRPDLFQVGRFVWLAPVRHILRGVYFEPFLRKNNFRVIYTASLLAYFSGGWLYGHYVSPPVAGGWDFDRPTLSDDLADRLEEVALPLVEPVDTVEAFLAYAMPNSLLSGSIANHTWRKALLDIALGDLASAERGCEALLAQERLAPQDGPPKFHPFTDVLLPLIKARDIPALAAFLHETEAASARTTQVEKHWQPSPFPLERLA